MSIARVLTITYLSSELQVHALRVVDPDALTDVVVLVGLPSPFAGFGAHGLPVRAFLDPELRGFAPRWASSSGSLRILLEATEMSQSEASKFSAAARPI